MTRLWDKGGALDQRVLAYTAGEDHTLDERLVAYDVRGSIAHAEGLRAAGLLSDRDADRIVDALEEIGAAHARGDWRISLEQEDGQTALEALLTERLGETGARIHLGRSRNDQVLTALRLYLRDAIAALMQDTESVVSALRRLAERQGEVALPGYTHLQQAMPSNVRLWSAGFAAELADDAEGIRAVLRRLAGCPLGSAAGYGTPGLKLDRTVTANRLGFAGPQEPVTAVQLSRGKAESQLLFELTLLMQDVGRMATDLILFYTREFSYVDLPEAFTTGSSIMPQKRNPDVFELMRGRGATALGCLTEALGIAAKLSSGYHRDLQLLKAPLFRGIDLAAETLGLLPQALDGLVFRPENIRADPAIHAAEAAYRLVLTEGIPFREAYRRIAAELKA